MARPTRAAPLTASRRAARLLAVRALLPAVAGVVGARPLSAQAARLAFPRPSLRAEIGVVGASPLVRDANGTTVRAQVAPLVGAAAAWQVAGSTSLSIFARGSRGSVSAVQGGRHWSAGTTSQLDLGAAVERALTPVVSLRAGVSASWLSGPEDLAPFRFNEGTNPRPSAEAGLGARLMRTRPLSGTVVAQAYRYGAGSDAAPLASEGTVTRLIATVRYGR